MLDFPPWKSWLIIISLALGVVFAAPNLLSEQAASRLPGWLPSKQVNLGLDLRGGSHLLLEVDRASVLKQQVETLETDVRTTLRRLRDDRGGGFGYGDVQVADRSVNVLMRRAGDVDAAVEAIRKLAIPVGSVSGAYSLDVTVVDGARIVTTLTEAGINARVDQAVVQSIETVRRRIDEVGTREPTIIRQGSDRIVVQVPGLQDPAQLKALLGKTAKLEFKLVDVNVSQEDIQRGRVPPGTQLLPLQAEPGQPAGQQIAVKRRTELTGDSLVDSQPSFQEGQPVVSFRFDSSGARRFAELTRLNSGKPFAIILDDQVISAPRINEPILGGSGIISGSFTTESANQLSVLLRAGALPAKLNILEERTVGPDLGADSIRAGTLAAVVGTVLVIALMIVTYGRFGVYSVIALLFNMAMILGILTVTGATLTLPGIAGLVLTMGAAVDANVLIFERIREELRHGRTTINAIETGYREASRAIWDANVTNLISAALMFFFGSGPIKGFAVVLTIGIVTSVYTGVTVCRWFTVLWLRRTRPQRLVI